MTNLSWKNLRSFGKKIKSKDFQEQVVGILWYRYHCDSMGCKGRNVLDIAQDMEEAGLMYSQDAIIRLQNITSFPYISLQILKGGYTIDIQYLEECDSKFYPLTDFKPEKTVSKYLIEPLYIEGKGSFKPVFDKLLEQINFCYQYEQYDACALLCRRLVEITLVKVFNAHDQMEVIEEGGRVKNLSFIIGQASSGNYFKLAKETKSVIEKICNTGNYAAHGNFITLKEKHIDNYKNDIESALVELLERAAITLVTDPT